MFPHRLGTTTLADTATPGDRRITSGSPPRLTSTHPSHAAHPSAATPTQVVPSFERSRRKRPSRSWTSRRKLSEFEGSLPSPAAMVNAETLRPSGATTRPVNGIVGAITTTNLSGFDNSWPISSESNAVR